MEEVKEREINEGLEQLRHGVMLQAEEESVGREASVRWKLKEQGKPGTVMFNFHSGEVAQQLMFYFIVYRSLLSTYISRVGHKTLENGKRVRYLIKTGEIIDNKDDWKKLKEGKSKTEVATTA